MILSSVGELLKHFGSSIAIFLSHMCNMIASVHVHIERDVCVPQPFLLTSMVGYRTERGGCSAAQTTLVRAETFSQADTHTRGRKAQWGREAPALFCLAAGKPPCLPPPPKRRVPGTAARRKLHHLWNESQHCAPTSRVVSFCRVPSLCSSPWLAWNHLRGLLLHCSCVHVHQCLAGEQWKEFGEWW